MLNKHRPHSLSAATVIAVLALSSAPAIAQDAAPVIDLPPAAGVPSPPVVAPAPPQPTIILPEVSAPAAASPVVAADNAQAEPAPRSSETRQAAPARPAAAAATRTAQVAPPPPAEPASPEAVAPIVAAPPVAQPAPEAEPVAAPAEPETGLGAEAGMLALLAALGLGGAALLAARTRRRRPYMTDEEAVMVEAVATDPVMPSAASPVMPAYSQYEDDHIVAPSPSAAIPAGAIPRGEERDALLRRMVAAEPDEANPFTSRKARLRRARLILQRLEREREREAAGDGSGFDWRTYRPARADAPADPVTV